MNERYEPRAIEPKWQARWAKEVVFRAEVYEVMARPEQRQQRRGRAR